MQSDENGKGRIKRSEVRAAAKQNKAYDKATEKANREARKGGLPIWFRSNLYSGLVIEFGTRIYQPGKTIAESAAAPRHDIAGSHAELDFSGSVNRRVTLTRVAVAGPLALAAPKKQDDRQCQLTVTGADGWSLLAVRPGDQRPKLVDWVNRYNQLAHELAGSAPPAARPSPMPREPEPPLVARLTELDDLRHRDLISEAEYHALRNQALGLTT